MKPFESVKLLGLPAPSMSNYEMFERFRTEAFSFGRMQGAITFTDGRLDCERWHDEMVPACYRARIGEICRNVFESHFRGHVYRGRETIVAFIDEARRQIYQHLDPIAPPPFKTHDDKIEFTAKSETTHRKGSPS